MIDTAWINKRIAELEEFRGQCLAELNATLGRLAELKLIGDQINEGSTVESLHISEESEA